MSQESLLATAPQSGSRLTRILESMPGAVLVAYAAFAAFATYFCIYAFRKPFAVATFEGSTFLGTAVALKTAIVISQLLGYALSKYIGIKVCSEAGAGRRALMLVVLMLWAESALVLFGAVPDDWKVVAIFLNGLPLGMVWGLVVWYLEGRRTSELLLAALSCSYILSSGVVKDVGRAILEGDAAGWWAPVPLIGTIIAQWMGQVSEGWMPAVAGLHFMPLFLISVWLLKKLPEPSAADTAERSQRQPMDRAARHAFLRRYLPGVVLLCAAFFFLTAYRDFRDNYQVEILEALGYPYARDKTLISKTETLVALGVMVSLAMLSLVRDNRRALRLAFTLMIGGLALIGLGTLGLQSGWVDGFWWMTLTGLGSYLAYVPFGAVLFERLVASTRTAGTAVFGIYLADSVGYTGSVAVQLYKDLGHQQLSHLAFFEALTYMVCILGVLCLACAAIYFAREGSGEAAAPTLNDPALTVAPSGVAPRSVA